MLKFTENISPRSEPPHVCMISTEALFETMGRDELEGGGYLLYYIYIYYAHIFAANVGVDGVLIVAGSKLVLTHPGLLNIKLLPIPLDYSWLDGG